MLKISWAPQYELNLPAGHRFPMEKYRLLPEQLLYEGTIEENQIAAPGSVSDEDILRVHDRDYWERLKSFRLTAQEERASGFPQSQEMLNRECMIMQGTLDMCKHALMYGCGLNTAGGTHHAFSNRGEGFCLLNDLAIAAAYLTEKQQNMRVLIVDLDVHQGNGTAEIFSGHKDVFTFSMHGEKNYPARKEKSHLDIALADGTSDETYLELLKDALKKIDRQFEPGFVLYQSGVDVLEGDKMGRLKMSIDGCIQRDRLIFEYCRKRNIPVTVTMGGGYSPKIRTIVEAHANTFRTAAAILGN
jgi:acetoin utilization deacetylase AcuC-like enzyme